MRRGRSFIDIFITQTVIYLFRRPVLVGYDGFRHPKQPIPFFQKGKGLPGLRFRNPFTDFQVLRGDQLGLFINLLRRFLNLPTLIPYLLTLMLYLQGHNRTDQTDQQTHRTHRHRCQNGFPHLLLFMPLSQIIIITVKHGGRQAKQFTPDLLSYFPVCAPAHIRRQRFHGNPFIDDTAVRLQFFLLPVKQFLRKGSLWFPLRQNSQHMFSVMHLNKGFYLLAAPH